MNIGKAWLKHKVLLIMIYNTQKILHLNLDKLQKMTMPCSYNNTPLDGDKQQTNKQSESLIGLFCFTTKIHFM